MAIVKLPDEHRTLHDPAEIRACMKSAGITHERWNTAHAVPPGAPAEKILAAYATEIESLKKQGGYVTVDVVDITPETPNLEVMLERFAREHWHEDDEVRFIIEGSGLFYIRPRKGPVFSVETTAGDLLCVPAGTWHWFHLCPGRHIRAIRLFQDPAGWEAHYTGSGLETSYPSVCSGARPKAPS